MEIFCREPTHLFDRSYKEFNDNILDIEINDSDCAILVINEDFVSNLNNNIIISPSSLPMICPPKKWSDSEYGGFLNNNILQNNIITGSEYHKHKIENKAPLYNAINKINNIKFKINNSLLDYLENDGKYLLKSYLENLKTKQN